jgi:hypothetical protein
MDFPAGRHVRYLFFILRPQSKAPRTKAMIEARSAATKVVTGGNELGRIKMFSNM